MKGGRYMTTRRDLRISAASIGIAANAANILPNRSHARPARQGRARIVEVHVANAGQLRPPATPPLPARIFVCKYNDGRVVLVGSGFGLSDLKDPQRRPGTSGLLIFPSVDFEFTARGQIESRGGVFWNSSN